MAKAKSLYVCSACGAQSYKWQGKCTNCDSWNTLELQEEPARKVKTEASASAVPLRLRPSVKLAPSKKSAIRPGLPSSIGSSEVE